jgi:hypothetical protein
MMPSLGFKVNTSPNAPKHGKTLTTFAFYSKTPVAGDDFRGSVPRSMSQVVRWILKDVAM